MKMINNQVQVNAAESKEKHIHPQPKVSAAVTLVTSEWKSKARWLCYFAAFCLLFACSAFGQGARFDSVAQKNVQGFLAPIPGATITVCTAAATGTPCSPVVPTSPVTLCTDASCSVAAPNPFLADSNGNFGFYALASNTYKVSITAPGVTGQLISVVMPMVGGGAGTFTTIIGNGASQTLTNLNSTVTCDGTKYTTIQAAAAALAATGGEVIVPSASACTWNGAGLTGNVTIRFNSAAATYAVTAPVVMTGGGNHLICNTGQSIGLSGQNNASFPNVGTVLNFTGNLTGTQDAISATSTNNNDANTVEGCYIKMGGSGRAGIHFSGENGSLVRFNVIADPASYCYWLDGGGTTGSHAYGNRIESMDCIHPGLEAYRMSLDPNGNGTGGDMDRTTFINAEMHPCDIGVTCNTANELGQGIHLLVPSTTNVANGIANTIFENFISNGTANNTYGMKLEVGRAGNIGIAGVTLIGAEIEDVFQANGGTAFTVTETAMTDITHVDVIGGGLIGPGYTTGNNFAGLNKINGLIYENGIPSSNTNAPNLFDTITFLNNFSNTVSCTGTNVSPGIRFGIAQPNLAILQTNDNITHFYQCATATDLFHIDVGNARVKPAADNTWRWGDHTVSRWNEVAAYNAYIATSFNFAGNNLLMSGTAPTIAAAGCGGAAASITANNGTAAFKVNVGTTPGSACTITMPAATTGWNCFATDITTNSTSVFLQKQTGAESTTQVVITNFNDVAAATAFTASDILKVACSAD